MSVESRGWRSGWSGGRCGREGMNGGVNELVDPSVRGRGRAWCHASYSQMHLMEGCLPQTLPC